MKNHLQQPLMPSQSTLNIMNYKYDKRMSRKMSDGAESEYEDDLIYPEVLILECEARHNCTKITNYFFVLVNIIILTPICVALMRPYDFVEKIISATHGTTNVG